VKAFGRLLALLALLLPGVARAHDPSAFGGLFRSPNAGQTWLNADTGLFINAALTVAVDPRDANDLLFGTDTGLLRSRNGGRGWVREANQTIIGAVFAVAFAPDGHTALCAAPSGIFRLQAGIWQQATAPADSVPARSIGFGKRDGRVYLLGQGHLFASDDDGANFTRLRSPSAANGPITSFALLRAPDETLLAVAGGRLWRTADGGRQWVTQTPPGDSPVDAVLADAASPELIWAVSQGALALSRDRGNTWHAMGRLPDAHSAIRGMAEADSGARLVATTDRGMFLSEDAGQTWRLQEANLPVHLESGPLAGDPADPRTLYAVYSLMPYGQVWRFAVQGGNLLARTDPVQIAGGIAFTLLLILAGSLLIYWLARQRAAPPRRAVPAHGSGHHG
jgi:photosystem II stability/assembly factor-like uncharacterized protein